MNSDETVKVESEYIKRHHRHELLENQCSSTIVHHIKAPLHLVSFAPSLSFSLFLQSIQVLEVSFFFVFSKCYTVKDSIFEMLLIWVFV